MIEHCLICFAELLPQVGWTDLFKQAEPTYVCEHCLNQLEKISGKTCLVCDRPLKDLDHKYQKGDTCHDCVRWEADRQWAGSLTKNDSILIYNAFAQEVIARYKFRGDYVLATAFSTLMKERLKSIPFDTIVPIPLSDERLYERGFNQSEALIRACGFEPTPLLTRIHTEKQSKKTRAERIHLSHVFQTNQNVEEKDILLVDDIYTTGSTLRHAGKELKRAGARTVRSLTLARG